MSGQPAVSVRASVWLGRALSEQAWTKSCTTGSVSPATAHATPTRLE